MIVAATWPSTPPPSQIIQRKRSISLEMSWLPHTTSGMENSSPKMTSPVCSFRVIGSAAIFAMATTLSKLIVMSATMIIPTAARSVTAFAAFVSVEPPSAASCTASSCGLTSFAAIHSSASPPASCRKGTASRYEMRITKITRNTTAPPAPKIRPKNCCFFGKERVASAMISALSPASSRSAKMIFTSFVSVSGSNIFVGASWYPV